MGTEASLKLKWTGHPVVDVGIATLCAMVGKDGPEKLSSGDLDTAATELEAAYSDPIFMAYLSCVFTMNAPYTNPTMKDESREASTRRMLFPHRGAPDAGAIGYRCAFSGESATHLLERSQMPMLTGAGVLNFFPEGLSELPVAAPYLLAIQAIAMGGRRSEGKLLIVHCDNPEFTFRFAQRYLADNRRIINLARANRLPDFEGPDLALDRESAGYDKSKGRPKYPDVKAPESLVMSDLVEIAADAAKGAMRRVPTSVTIYLMSNSGQGPSLAIEQVSSAFMEFLFHLHGEHANRWKKLVHRAWRQPKAAGKAKDHSPALPIGPGRSRNDLYNDLLPIFAHGFVDWTAATRFIRRHLLSDATRFWMDPSRVPHLAPKFGREQLELIDWELTRLFLERVLGMNTERLETIREFADRLAGLIDDHNDKRLFRDLVFTAGEWQYRATLVKVQRQYAQDQNKLLIGFDEYVDVFLAEDAGDRVSWSLVRDLISIRLVERLHEKEFFARPGNESVLVEPEQTEGEKGEAAA